MQKVGMRQVVWHKVVRHKVVLGSLTLCNAREAQLFSQLILLLHPASD
jgi:hypothetical protein